MLQQTLNDEYSDTTLPSSQNKFSIVMNDSLGELERGFSGSWLTRSLNAFLDIETKVDSLKKLSQMLNSSVQDVVQSLETLEKLGIIVKTESGFKKILKYIYYPDRALNKKKSIEDHVLISTQILNKLSANSKSKNFYRTSFVATNTELVRQFTDDYDKLLRKFLMDSENTTKDSIYSMTSTGIEIYNSKSKENEL